MHEGDDLAVLRVVRQWSCLRGQHHGSDGLQPGRDEVAEGPNLGDVAMEPDTQDAVVVTVGDEEPAAMALQGVLHPGGDEEVRGRRMVDRPLTDVGDHLELAMATEAVDADGRVANRSTIDDVPADHRDEHVGGAADELHVHRSTDAQHLWREPVGVRAGGAGPPVDTQHAARIGVGHVQRPVGADGAARGQTAAELRQRRDDRSLRRSLRHRLPRRIRPCPRMCGRGRQHGDDCCREDDPSDSHGVPPSGMFWFTWKKLVGSYFLFSATSRS